MGAKPVVSRNEILSRIPSDAQRVRVTDEFGKMRWREKTEIADSDTIDLDDDGIPICMAGRLGRPQKQPLAGYSEKIGEMVQKKKEFMEEDDLYSVVSDNPEKSEVLDYVIKALAEETASLGFERTEAERKGEPTSQISLRRVNALKAVGDTWLKRREQMTANSIDLDSIAFKRLFKYITETFNEAMHDAGLRPELAESVFASFSKKVSDDAWDNEATKRMLGDD